MRASLFVIAPTLIGLVAIFAMLAPVGVSPEAWTSPHLLLVVLAFWCLRRPGLAPPIVIFGLGLLLDLARAGPVGLELFALLVTTEALRASTYRLPVFGFQAEMLRVVAAVTLFELLGLALLAATFAAPPALEAIGLRWLFTILVYPLVAAMLEARLGVRRGEEALGGAR